MVDKNAYLERIIKIHERKTGKVLTTLDAQELFANLVRLASVVFEYDQ